MNIYLFSNDAFLMSENAYYAVHQIE